MRKESKKRKALREAKAIDRLDYLLEHPDCVACFQEPATDVHEICRGSHRHIAYGEISTWLPLGRECHEEFDCYELWPIAKQLALKLLWDRENYCLELVNEIRGRAPGAITHTEVIIWACRLADHL